MDDRSKYTRFLPAVYREGSQNTGPEFVDRLLQGFERALGLTPSVMDDPLVQTTDPQGVEDLLANISGYFDPTVAPPQFIDYLASWVALELEQSEDWMGTDFGETTQELDQLAPLAAVRDTRNRDLIQNAASLYRIRGTKAGIEEYLKIYAGDISVQISELTDLFTVGVTSVVGADVMIGERPHYFQVRVSVPAPNPTILAQYKRAVRAIIDNEKPAHTYYDLLLETPTMQISPTGSRVGVNTLLGGIQLG